MQMEAAGEWHCAAPDLPGASFESYLLYLAAHPATCAFLLTICLCHQPAKQQVQEIYPVESNGFSITLQGCKVQGLQKQTCRHPKPLDTYTPGTDVNPIWQRQAIYARYRQRM
jgi:hypothetical protein